MAKSTPAAPSELATPPCSTISAGRVAKMFRDADHNGPWPSAQDCGVIAASLTRAIEAPPVGRIPVARSPALKAGQVFRKRLRDVIEIYEAYGAAEDAALIEKFAESQSFSEVMNLISLAPRPRLRWHLAALEVATKARAAWALAGKREIGLTNDGPLVTFVTLALIKSGCLPSDPDANHNAAVGKVLRTFWPTAKQRKKRDDPVREALRRRIDRRN
jgi:hypothetical protein